MPLTSGPFEILHRKDFEKLPTIKWRVEGLLPEGSIICLFGEPKIKKTYAAVSLGLAVAAGEPWFGFPTRQGRVLYVCSEGYYGLLQREEAWRNLHVGGRLVEDFFTMRQPINFYTENAVNSIVVAEMAFKSLKFKPDVLIIDTLARSMVGGNENETKDMSIVCEKITAFQRDMGFPTILIVHHTTKDGLTMRGSSVIPGHVDGMIKTAAFDNGKLKITSEGYRDAADFDPIVLAFKQVLIETEKGFEYNLAASERVAATITDLMDGEAKAASSTLNQQVGWAIMVLYGLPPGGRTSNKWKRATIDFTEAFQHPITDPIFRASVRPECAKRGLVQGGGGQGMDYELTDKGMALYATLTGTGTTGDTRNTGTGLVSVPPLRGAETGDRRPDLRAVWRPVETGQTGSTPDGDLHNDTQPAAAPIPPDIASRLPPDTKHGTE